MADGWLMWSTAIAINSCDVAKLELASVQEYNNAAIDLSREILRLNTLPLKYIQMQTAACARSYTKFLSTNWSNPATPAAQAPIKNTYLDRNPYHISKYVSSHTPPSAYCMVQCNSFLVGQLRRKPGMHNAESMRCKRCMLPLKPSALPDWQSASGRCSKCSPQWASGPQQMAQGHLAPA